MDIEINGHGYRVGKLDAVKQLHVARRVLPFMLQMGLSAATLKEILAGGAGREQMVAVIQPAIEALSTMTDDEVNYVLDASLRVVSRRTDDGTGYAPVWVVQSTQGAMGALAFFDITLPTMLQLVQAVLKENLSGFFAA